MTLRRYVLLHEMVPAGPRRQENGPRARRVRRALTIAEVLVVIGIIVVLSGLLLPMFSRARSTSRSVACLSNLHHIALAFRMYSQDNDGRLPYPAYTQIPWERSLMKYVPAELFRCPSDQELAPATGSSYDWRDTGVDSSTLAGRSLSDPQREDVILAFDALPAWHEPGQINVVRCDGSALPMPQDACIRDLHLPIARTMVIKQD